MATAKKDVPDTSKTEGPPTVAPERPDRNARLLHADAYLRDMLRAGQGGTVEELVTRAFALADRLLSEKPPQR